MKIFTDEKMGSYRHGIRMLWILLIIYVMDFIDNMKFLCKEKNEISKIDTEENVMDNASMGNPQAPSASSTFSFLFLIVILLFAVTRRDDF